MFLASQPIVLKHNIFFSGYHSYRSRKCCFQTNNMDKMIFINKKWPFNTQINYLDPINITSTCEVEFDLLKELEVKFQGQVKDLLYFHILFHLTFFLCDLVVGCVL